MLSLLMAMLAIVALAALIVVYVAFPHRGREVPRAPWVGHAMRRGADLLPTLEDEFDASSRAPLRQPVRAGRDG